MLQGSVFFEVSNVGFLTKLVVIGRDWDRFFGVEVLLVFGDEVPGVKVTYDGLVIIGAVLLDYLFEGDAIDLTVQVLPLEAAEAVSDLCLKPPHSFLFDSFKTILILHEAPLRNRVRKHLIKGVVVIIRQET